MKKWLGMTRRQWSRFWEKADPVIHTIGDTVDGFVVYVFLVAGIGWGYFGMLSAKAAILATVLAPANLIAVGGISLLAIGKWEQSGDKKGRRKKLVFRVAAAFSFGVTFEVSTTIMEKLFSIGG